jgi:hypothetical protein
MFEKSKNWSQKYMTSLKKMLQWYCGQGYVRRDLVTGGYLLVSLRESIAGVTSVSQQGG